MVNVKLKLLGLLLALTAGLAGCAEPEDTRPGQPVAHRKKAFKAMFQVFDPMGAMLKKDTLDMPTLQALAKQLAEKKDVPWQYFGPDTQYPPSHAKDAVWSERARFQKIRDDFLAASDSLVAAVAKADRPTIQAAYDKLHATCETCHKAFKSAAR